MRPAMKPGPGDEPKTLDFVTLLTLSEVAKMLKISKSKAFEMANKGTFFKVLRVGERNLRVHPADLAAYIEQLREDA
ncbi:hypothetical protein KSD_50080 [Ktedonobacter sp. SOSP1-85]|nr:hypothetical protein KSD_50080 [Ktedonobacter sp. SOSP1-85]